MRLDQWLLKRSKWPWSLVQRTIRQQKVSIDGVKTPAAGYKLQSGDTVLLGENVHLEAPPPAKSHISQEFRKWIIAETEEHIVISKPAGVPSQGGKGIKASVDVLARNYCPTARLMHRLDRDTTGLLALAKSREACLAPIRLKVYLGVTVGAPVQDSGEVFTPIVSDGVSFPAHTSYQVLSRTPKFALVKYFLHTGRKHQIRIHSSFSLFCPILGDLRHGKTACEVGLCLHSWQFQVGNRLYTAPLPANLSGFMSQVGLVI